MALDPGDAADLWTEVLALEALVADADREALDARLEQLVAEPGELGAGARLVAAALRVRSPRDARPELVEDLVELVGDPDEALAGQAAEVLGELVAREGLLEDEPRWTAVEDLLERAGREGASEGFQLQVAAVVHRVGAPSQKREARTRILGLRAEGEPQVRAEATVVLAELGDEVRGNLAEELERLAGLPGPLGSRAAVLLAAAELRRAEEDRLRQLERTADQKRLPPELADIHAVMRMVEGLHLEGDRYTRDELKDMALEGMLRALDPHSSYMPSDAYGEFYWDTFEPQYGGIGAYVNIDPTDGLPSIARPIYSGPAYKAGLKSDDKLVRIDDFPTAGEHLDEIIKRLKGKPGTPVTVYVWRHGMDPGLVERPTDEMAVLIVRDRIALPTAAWQMLPGKIGLIQLNGFNALASRELARGLTELLSQGMRGLVLDLRYNGGGVLGEARNVADLFLGKEKLVVTTEYRISAPDKLFTRMDPLVPEDLPMAVMLNRFSASASEIVAGALADYGRAVIVGERSFGKGAIQQLHPVEGRRDDAFEDENENGRFDTWEELVVDRNGNGEFDFAPRARITMGRYLLPSGRSIHRELDAERNVVWQGGISPDIPVEARRIEGWRLQEQLRINAEQAPRRYVSEHWDANVDLFRELATTDRKDPSHYPEFDAFYDSLETVAPRDDVRFLVRAELRRRFQDERGGEYPFGDFQEDVQIQAAIRSLLESLGEPYTDFVAYASTFEREDATLPDELLAGREPDAAEIDQRLEEIRLALSGDVALDREALEGLADLLSRMDR